MDPSGDRGEDLWLYHLLYIPANSEANPGESCERIPECFVFMAVETFGDSFPEGGGGQDLRTQQALLCGSGSAHSCQILKANLFQFELVDLPGQTQEQDE
jgi:hypothetical protein